MSDRLKYERFLWFHRQVKDGRYPNAAALRELVRREVAAMAGLYGD